MPATRPLPQPKKAPVLDSLVGAQELHDVPPPLFIKGFLGGPSGSGKTQSSITLPLVESKPLLLVDYDNRWETVRDEIESGLVKLVTIYDPDPNSPKGWDQAERLRKELWAAARGEFPFSGVIEDGLTSMLRLAMNSALTLRGKDGRDSTGLGGTPSQGHWGAQIMYLHRHINSVRNLPCHYILTGHFDIEKDEDDGKIKVMPKVTRSLRTEVPSWFNEVYNCYRIADKDRIRYFWMTGGTGTYEFFKSTLNNKGRYWKDPVEIDFSNPPVGFERLIALRKGVVKQ